VIRVKCFNIFLDHLISENKFTYPFRESLKKFHYKIKFLDPDIQNDITFDDFDYTIIKADINPFANTLVNEIWPLLRTLWKTRGGYQAKIIFNPEIDLVEFGLAYGPGVFTADYSFSITHEGLWEADFQMDFVQKIPENDSREPERQGPFMAQDYSRIQSPSATRARRIAKPKWGESGRSEKDFDQMIEEQDILNKTINFSFSFKWTESGKWSKPS
jgi:hypothetical protein